MKRFSRFIGVLFVMITLAVPSVDAANPIRLTELNWQCFEETGFCIRDRFRSYWEENGGLEVFGYPISTIYGSYEKDKGVTFVQWFERGRMEYYHNNEQPYDVLLGHLGKEDIDDWESYPKADPSTPYYVPDTGHAIASEFWEYYNNHGLNFDGIEGYTYAESLALFGHPLTEPMMETNSSGDTVLTQYFERARFEYHPNNPEPYKVLLGLLGNEISGWDVESLSTNEEAVFIYLNCKRAEEGLSPLIRDHELDIEAAKYVDMFASLAYIEPEDIPFEHKTITNMYPDYESIDCDSPRLPQHLKKEYFDYTAVSRVGLVATEKESIGYPSVWEVGIVGK